MPALPVDDVATFCDENENNDVCGSVGSLNEEKLKISVDSSNGRVNKVAGTEKAVAGASWKTGHYHSLPEWLKDNEYLHNGHRPPLETFTACLKSIFSVHTETGNIWSHMLGCLAFIVISACFFSRSEDEIELETKLAFLPFFLGAVACMGLSCVHHTVHCHSEGVGKIFRKSVQIIALLVTVTRLDYVGIALLIVGSFIPWLHYGFYCQYGTKIGYMALITVLGTCCIVVSLLNKFSTPQYRPLRAALFVSLGLSAVIPGCHHLMLQGFWISVSEASLGWMILMAVLYISGAVIYAMRVPEKLFPGKCDIWFQSHQIFHLLVVAAAFVHLHGITIMATQRVTSRSCDKNDYVMPLDVTPERTVWEL